MSFPTLTNQFQPSMIRRQVWMDGPTCEHTATSVATEGEEKTKEMHSLPKHPARKDALMALSLLDSVISSSDTDKRIVKAMDELQGFVSKVCKNTLKQKSIESYFKKQ
jgi:hypothetical protein